MRRRDMLSQMLTAVAPLALAPALRSQEPERLDEGALIRVEVDVVNILASVREKKTNKLITSLQKQDFILEEEGVEQTVRYFSQQSDLPLTVGLLVDTSPSQERVIYQQVGASSKFFPSVLRLEKDLAFLMSFDVDVELLQDLTGSQELLLEGLNHLEIQSPAGGITPGTVPSRNTPSTALYDSIYLACNEVLQPQVGRKAIVLISDGIDWGSRVKIDEAIEAAHRNDVIIYGIRYFDYQAYARAGVGTGGSGALKKLARETGGQMYEVGRKRTLDWIYQQISDELRNQYSLGYSSSAQGEGGGFRRIEVRTHNRRYEVTAREGYYAKG